MGELVIKENDVIAPSNFSEVKHLIVDAEIKNHLPGHYQVLLTLINGYQVSLVKGPFAYAGEKCVEVGVLWKGELQPIFEDENVVFGWADEAKTIEIIKMAANLTPKRKRWLSRSKVKNGLVTLFN